MLCSNFHIHHCLLKDKKNKIKTFPYLPTYPETEEYIRNRLIFF